MLRGEPSVTALNGCTIAIVALAAIAFVFLLMWYRHES
jgi:hypothetical protein